MSTKYTVALVACLLVGGAIGYGIHSLQPKRGFIDNAAISPKSAPEAGTIKFDEPIPPFVGDILLNGYRDWLGRIPDQPGDTTLAVGFITSNLREWLETLPANCELRIHFARYPANIGEYSNRNTVVLWPYQNNTQATDPNSNERDKRIRPFNIGSLYP